MPARVEAFHYKQRLAPSSDYCERPEVYWFAEQAQTREYILPQLELLHLAAEAQEAMVVNEDTGPPMPVARVKNIVAGLNGEQEGKAVRLVAHSQSGLHPN